MTALFFGSPGLLRSFSWKGLALFLLFAVALTAWSWSGVLLTPKTLTFQEQSEYFVSLLQRNLLNYFPIYFLAALADGLPLAGRRRLVVLGLAVFLGALLAVQVRCAVNTNQLFYVYGAKLVPYCTAWPTWSTYFEFPAAFIAPLTLGALVLTFVLARRRDAEMAAALHAAGAAQIEARRQRIESDIAAMQSRVDPDGLLETLRTVRSRYEASLAEGEARLDALITELREAARQGAVNTGGRT